MSFNYRLSDNLPFIEIEALKTYKSNTTEFNAYAISSDRLLLIRDIDMKTYVRTMNAANRIFALILALSLGMSSFLFWSVNTHAEEDIPEYSGSASVILNNNVPGFTADDITTSSFERYGDLDKLGRCTPAIACIGKDLMPTEERQSIGDVRPTGWKQNKYPGLIDTDPPFLYNRCHMIGFQLTGENANEKNLITGTRYMNVEGMLPYENQVAEYVLSTGRHVQSYASIYREKSSL